MKAILAHPGEEQTGHGHAWTSTADLMLEAVSTVFEDAFLILHCRRSIREMRAIARRTAELSEERDRFENAVEARTSSLATAVSRFRSLASSAPIAILQTDHAGIVTMRYARPEDAE